MQAPRLQCVFACSEKAATNAPHWREICRTAKDRQRKAKRPLALDVPGIPVCDLLVTESCRWISSYTAGCGRVGANFLASVAMSARLRRLRLTAARLLLTCVAALAISQASWRPRGTAALT